MTTKKKSPSILLVVNLISPDGRYDQLYMSNYATINIRDALARVKGVGDVMLFGARDYSMRVWLDPDQLASRNLTTGDVIQALQEQNVQVAAGRIGQPPVPTGQQFQFTINTLGRLLEAEQFDDIVIKTASDGQIVYLRDVGRTELGAQSYDVNCFLDGQPSVGLAVYQLPGSNALATAEAVRSRMEELKKQFPQGLDYAIKYDTTIFVDESIHEVYKTLFEAILLVFIVVLVFLQDWRATIIPMIAVPVSLIGTFAVMAMLGFSINNLSLFGLVLAIGIVVDDAIVVVENFERWLAEGMSPRDAARKAMDEVSGPVIAIALVLSSVFIPTAFITGISGQFYRQFALTIAASTIISAFNSLTLSPALVRRVVQGSRRRARTRHAKSRCRRWASPCSAASSWPFFGEPSPPASPAALSPTTTPARRTAPGGSRALRGDRAVHRWAASRAPAQRLGQSPAQRVLSRLQLPRSIGSATAMSRRPRQFLRLGVIVMLIYAGMMVLTYLGFRTVPVGFIPPQDKGYLRRERPTPGRREPRTDRRSREAADRRWHSTLRAWTRLTPCPATRPCRT